MINKPCKSGRILIVDDQQDMCWVLSKLLTARGHTVGTAQSVLSALKALESLDFQVTIVDYRLPDGNGLDLIDKMRLRLPDLHSILMTSYGNAALKKAVANAKLFAYFDKPFDNSLVIRAVEEAIAGLEAGIDSLTKGIDTRNPFKGPSKGS